MKQRNRIACGALFVVMVVCLAACSGDGGWNFSEKEPRYILTADSNDATVTVVDAETLAVETTIDVSMDFPWEITVSDDNTRAYVSCRGARDGVDKGGISIIDLESFTEIGTITGLTGTDPCETELVGDTLYVAFVDNQDADTNDMISVVDLSAATPAETAVITLTGYNEKLRSLAATADGAKLYAAGDGNWLHVIDLTQTPAALDTTLELNADYLHDIEIVDDKLYLPGYGTEAVEILDTTTDSLLTETIPVGYDTPYLMGLEMIGTTVWSANSWGGLGKTDLTRNMDNFDWSYGDDNYMTVTLPFTFPFDGTDYDEIYMGTNGVLTFDESVAGEYDYGAGHFNGFSPLPENLDSTADLFNISYNVSADGERAVFQWCTATYSNAYDPMTVTVFEVVLYADGRVRFDYRGSGENAIDEDDGYTYGIGDGTDTILDLETITGVSAFELEKKSYMWDPADPDTATEVDFVWEGTGVTWLPVPGMPHGIASIGDKLVFPLPKDMYDGSTMSSLGIFDTVTETVTLVTVGSGPRAVALVY